MKKKLFKKIILLSITFLFILGLSVSALSYVFESIEVVSVNDVGADGDSGSIRADISSDGNYVAFSSGSSNLVSGDTNGQTDIFIHDRNTSSTKRVSISDLGIESNNYSLYPSVSSNGSLVAFYSIASNLIPNDLNGQQDVFVYDVGVDSLKRISEVGGVGGNAPSEVPSVSDDGSLVVFGSQASNLIANDTNGFFGSDIFVYNMTTDAIKRVSIASDGSEGNSASFKGSISSNNRYVTFFSYSTNLLGVGVDTNGQADIFVYDMDTDTIERVSVASDGTEGNAGSYYVPSISGDGRYVVFVSDASNLVDNDTNGQRDVFVHDRGDGSTKRVSIANDGTEGNSDTYNSTISSNGRYISFESNSSNLVLDDTNGQADIFVYDMDTDTIERVSNTSDETQGDGSSYNVAISSDGRHLVFDSNSTNLIPGHSGHQIYLVTRHTPAPPTSNKKGEINWTCQDTKATNYNPSQFSRHKQSMCTYEEVETTLDTTECPHFTQYFRFGDNNEEIKKLQTFLQEQGFNTGYIDSTMGPITFNAVKEFQNKYSNEILKPWNLSKATGRWYQSTRHKANELAGCSEGSLTLDNGVVIDD